MKLDLACGQRCKEGFEGVDIGHCGQRFRINLLYNWPWETDTIEELHCAHFIEHIPHDTVHTKDGFFYFFDQAWRVIKPGSLFTLVWPALQSVRAFMDPTHRRFIPLEAMHYLNRAWREQNGLSHYNVNCDWELVSATLSVVEGGSPELAVPAWNIAQDYTVVLRAVK